MDTCYGKISVLSVMGQHPPDSLLVSPPREFAETPY